MYSVVLATMLTAGAQTTTFGWHCHGCHSSCHSCSGVYVYNAFSCHGCHSYCSSCSCSCSYSWCHGCSGCHGCHVTVVLGGCHGCHGCCYYSGCHGCCYYSSCSCSGVVYYPQVVQRVQMVEGPRGGGGGMGVGPLNDMERKAVEDLLRKLRDGKGDKKGFEKKEEQSSEAASVSPTKARVVVRAPADARLWVDQVECPLPGTVRSFETPDLNPEQNYVYTLRVAVERNGQTVQESRRVTLTPGQQVQVDFNNVGATRTAATE